MKKVKDMNGRQCSCGRIHAFHSNVIIGSGVIRQLPCVLKKMDAKKVFILSDKNTHQAAGEQVCSILRENNIPFADYCFPVDHLEPDEASVGAAFMHYDVSCDTIIGVGSGVINDIGKILSCVSGKPYIIVATAPSMDGYASASSSMTRDGLKISLPAKSADVIIGDTQILCQAPLHMMKAGLGDMLAKYVSICEWRISRVITGEYYCEEVAGLIRGALSRCVDHAQGLLQRDEAAVQAVFEGLVIGGIAMNYAGLSRPASGVEHYISHILDMRAVEFGCPAELHGIQCAVGTVLALRLYDKLKTVIPNRETACRYAEAFDYDSWAQELRTLLGKGAESMIQLEQTEHKYDPEQHKNRIEIILDNWEQILKIIDEELPSPQELKSLLKQIDMPVSLPEIGVSEKLLPAIFRATKDIRDKYVLSRLVWDLGIIDEFL